LKSRVAVRYSADSALIVAVRAKTATLGAR
jgi:hypothetical protein